MREAYTTLELTWLLGVGSKSTITRRASRESWESRPRKGRGGGNEWLTDSMPEATWKQVHEAVQRNALEMAVATSEFTHKSDAMMRQESLAQLAKCSDVRQRRAEARALLAQACRAFIENHRSTLSETAARHAWIAEYLHGRVHAPEWVQAAIPTVCASSLVNWERTLANNGIAGLAGRYGHRAGTGKIDTDKELLKFAEGFLAEFPDAEGTALHGAMKARFGKDRTPHVRAVQKWLKRWKRHNEQMFMALANPDKWRSKHLLAHGSASESIIRLNQRWELDSTPADILLADGSRHALVGVVDCWSRRGMLHLCRTSSSAGICSLLRRALPAWGVPETACTDNGQDYASERLRTALLGLGILQEFAPPFSPDKKPFVERFFKTFSHDLLELMPGFVGHNVAERKAIEARKSFADRMMRKGETIEVRMTEEQFREFLAGWERYYEVKTHGGEGMEGMSPNAKAASWHRPVPQIEKENKGALDILLLPPADGDGGWRTVGKKGLRVEGCFYIHPALGAKGGARVRCLLDEADLGYIYVFDEDGEFVCRAEDPDVTGVSRRELAIAARRKQADVAKNFKKHMREAAKAANVKDIAREILEAGIAEGEAQGPAAPQAETPYTTPALEEAARAARAGEAPVAAPVSERETAQRAKLDAMEASRQGKVIEMGFEAADKRYRRALDLEAAIEAGREVADSDRRWLTIYSETPEYRARKRLGWMETGEGRMAL